MKLGNSDITLKVGSVNVDAAYIGTTLVYSGGTTPTYKWIATYSGGTTYSAECDSTSAITENEITKTNLVSVDISDCVTNIDNYTFSGLTSLTSCTIGSGITSIGDDAFRNCTSLTSITITATVPPSLGNSFVLQSTNECPIYVPSESVSTYIRIWGRSYRLRIQAIPSS